MTIYVGFIAYKHIDGGYSLLLPGLCRAYFVSQHTLVAPGLLLNAKGRPDGAYAVLPKWEGRGVPLLYRITARCLDCSDLLTVCCLKGKIQI